MFKQDFDKGTTHPTFHLGYVRIHNLWIRTRNLHDSEVSRDLMYSEATGPGFLPEEICQGVILDLSGSFFLPMLRMFGKCGISRWWWEGLRMGLCCLMTNCLIDIRCHIYNHTFSKPANHQIRHQATHIVGVQPGDCIQSLQSSLGKEEVYAPNLSPLPQNTDIKHLYVGFCILII